MENNIAISIGLPLSLFIIMTGIGMTLAPRDFHRIAFNPRPVVLGTLLQIVLMPLAAYAISALLDLPPELAVGLVIIAACPGGTTSNLFVMLGKGSVALSIVLTVLASLITVATLPLFTSHALGYYTGSEQTVSLPLARTIIMLLAVVLVPVSLGMLLKSKAPQFSEKAERYVGLFGAIVLAALVVAIIARIGGEQLLELLSSAGPAAALLNIAGIVLGLGTAYLLKLRSEDALAVAIELGIKNGTLGLMVTLTLLESDTMSVPSAVYGVLMFFFGFLLVMLGRVICTKQTS
ncbi:bile acid:sodium symporter [gamma proteobacterium HTCC5015]|nr:bile acid:sodium symporter [gamma proteobacterium HTCC5015]